MKYRHGTVLAKFGFGVIIFWMLIWQGKKLSGEPHGVGKPNLFVIGAAKCGTTYLHDVLSQHGEIFMSGIKEPRYFTRDDDRELRAWHEELFSENPDKAVIGESSPSYSETTYFVSFPSQWTGHK